MFNDNSEICPVTVFCFYLQKTAEQVATLRPPRAVFITSRKPIRQARPGTIDHWIKNILGASGINTDVHSAHSTRSASTSWAASKRVPINDILKAAN